MNVQNNSKIPKEIEKAKIKSSTIKTKNEFNVVGIGASAGGLEALEKFFLNMPLDSGSAFVVVTHLDPKHVSIMPELIQKYTQMEVNIVKDGMKVKPNSVYVIPSNKRMYLRNRALKLIELSEYHEDRLPIDFFFISLAEDIKERAIGIVLSGTGNDGTIGLKKIKEEMGVTIAQEPSSAKYDGMPISAINSKVVDYVLPVDKIPEKIIAFQKRLFIKNLEKDETDDYTLGNYEKICAIIKSHTGHDFSFYKKNTIYRRVERRMSLQQIEKISDYISYLSQNTTEVDTLYRDLLIGVTNFFRNSEAFEELKQIIIPELIRDKPEGYCLRVWAPGCSSGEETYSLAIIIQECIGNLNKNINVQIFGTDIDDIAIGKARIGVYPKDISTDVSEERLKRFFMREDGNYRIKKNIREMVLFATQNIIRDPPFTKIDILCCRNLLIYIKPEMQRRIMPIFHYSLKRDGVLFLGNSETIGNFTQLFSVLDRKWKIYKKIESITAKNHIVDFALMPRSEILMPARSDKIIVDDIPRLTEKILLEKYAPPCVIIDENGVIRYIQGRVGKYLELAPGEARLNIFEMAPEGLKMEIQIAVRKALSQKIEVISENLRLQSDNKCNVINLKIKPLKTDDNTNQLTMVIFEEPKQLKQFSTQKNLEIISDSKTAGLAKELAYTKETLKLTIDELQLSNEELKSTNEEIQSSNEELQSANEELETSREELQSLNEELITVNTELQSKLDELSQVNNDMKNLLDSIEVPTIFLNNDLSIKRFTIHAKKIINLIPSDIGRPISHIVPNFDYDRLVEDSQEVLDTLVFKEIELRTKSGQWYMMRILPYRTTDNMIDGLVIIFIDIQQQKTIIDELKRLDKKLNNSLKYNQNIVDTIREALVILDSDLRVISANHSFYNIFKLLPIEVEGKHIYKINNDSWDIPLLRKLLEEIIPCNNFFDNFEVEHDFPLIGKKRLLLNARTIIQKEEGVKQILLAIEDKS